MPAQINTPATKHLALREIELEISMKKRIEETVEARIAWALLLQESLQDESTGPSPFFLCRCTQSPTDCSVNGSFVGANEFQDAALEALDAIEQPCDLILTREPLFGSAGELNVDDCAAPTGLPPYIPPDAVDPPGQTHYPSRTSSSRHRIVRNPGSNLKLLFIRNRPISSDPPGAPSQYGSDTGVARIQCPDCGRWDFSNLQGFLNHCRIRHRREYGSHDECIQECSVLVASSERDWVLQNGTEVTGVGIPSLRSLFEIAVGKKISLFPTLKPDPSSDQDTPTIEHKEDAIIGEAATEGTHLLRTLGVHEETPALAAILGRRAARRQIRVFNENEPVDIENCDATPRSKRRWKMAFSHRNLARPDLDVDIDLAPDSRPKLSHSIGIAVSGGEDEREVIPDTARFGPTRFHFTCRIVVTDRSRWLSPGEF